MPATSALHAEPSAKKKGKVTGHLSLSNRKTPVPFSSRDRAAWIDRDIAGIVAAIIEDDPGAESERISKCTFS
jgi:hypothetical protein